MNLIGMLKNRTSYKRMSGHNILGLLQFSQNLMQIESDPYMQLPNFTAEDCSKLKQNNENMKFYKFVTLEETKRQEILAKTFPDDKKK